MLAQEQYALKEQEAEAALLIFAQALQLKNNCSLQQCIEGVLRCIECVAEGSLGEFFDAAVAGFQPAIASAARTRRAQAQTQEIKRVSHRRALTFRSDC